MLKSKVSRIRNALLFTVNGKPVAPLAYVTYNPAKGCYRQFGQNQVKLFSVAVYLGDQGINSASGIRPFRPGFWQAEGKYDFSVVQEDYSRILEQEPEALIFPRIYFDVPVWWEQQHPDQTARDYHGNPLRQSFASPRWLEDCRKALTHYYDWLKQSGFENHVAGCQIAAGNTEEWYYHSTHPGQLLDYSEVNRMAFHAWLKQKYAGHIHDLNATWHSSFSAFDEAPIPSPHERKYALHGEARDVTREMPTIDYLHYHSWAIARAITILCGQVKKETNGNHVAGGFYGYVMELINPDCGHHALKEVLECPDVDFLASPPSYGQSRAMGVDWPLMGAAESVMIHDKMWFIEADVRTSLSQFMKETLPFAAPEGNTRYENMVWKGPAQIEQSLGAMGKVFARALTHNTAIWWFDMWAGWYDHPELMKFINDSSQLYQQAMLAGGGTTTAEIAVIVDETAFSRFCANSNAMNQAVYQQRFELGYLGSPYHTYLFSDLARIPVERYRMILFLNAVHISKEDRALIASRYEKDGRTLVWLGLTREPGTGNTGFAASGHIDMTHPSLAETSAYPIATDANGVATLVMVTQKDYHFALVAHPVLKAHSLRELALLSGVHIYSHSGDVVYANQDFIAIHAASDGEKRLYFPGYSDGEVVFGRAGNFKRKLYHDFSMEMGQTIMWRVKPAGRVS